MQQLMVLRQQASHVHCSVLGAESQGQAVTTMMPTVVVEYEWIRAGLPPVGVLDGDFYCGRESWALNLGRKAPAGILNHVKSQHSEQGD